MSSEHTSPHDGRQVRLYVFENEPVARLWEGRLWAEGVPCVVRPLGVGAAFGSTASVPHALYVPLAHVDRAREVLGQEVEPPLEVQERQRADRAVLWVLLLVALAISLAAAVGVWAFWG